MRLTLLLFLVCVLTLPACDGDEQPPLTPAQQQMSSAIRQASISNSERMLGRPLTEREKTCIVVEFENGYPVAAIEAPLSETLLARQDELARQQKSREATP